MPSSMNPRTLPGVVASPLRVRDRNETNTIGAQSDAITLDAEGLRAAEATREALSGLGVYVAPIQNTRSYDPDDHPMSSIGIVPRRLADRTNRPAPDPRALGIFDRSSLYRDNLPRDLRAAPRPSSARVAPINIPGVGIRALRQEYYANSDRHAPKSWAEVCKSTNWFMVFFKFALFAGWFACLLLIETFDTDPIVDVLILIGWLFAPIFFWIMCHVSYNCWYRNDPDRLDGLRSGNHRDSEGPVDLDLGNGQIIQMQSSVAALDFLAQTELASFFAQEHLLPDPQETGRRAKTLMKQFGKVRYQDFIKNNNTGDVAPPNTPEQAGTTPDGDEIVDLEAGIITEPEVTVEQKFLQ